MLPPIPSSLCRLRMYGDEINRHRRLIEASPGFSGPFIGTAHRSAQIAGEVQRDRDCPVHGTVSVGDLLPLPLQRDPR